ncbi:MAG: Holliday junction resolvase RuvX [Bacteroidota bacterium]
MGRILAIDFGQKRAGIAVTDELQMIANPLTTISASKAIEFIQEYISHENVDCIVVGEARDLQNRPSESAKYIEPFVTKLHKKFHWLTIERIDERFTSKIAMQAIIDAQLKKKDRQNRELVDSVSATIILQSYLETMDFRSKNEIL